ncbi:MAG TPA: UDP-3-O-(3-hydroxymyristoyl)glucosamine N-acyltransferase [Candidatus Dormibacteraeota bacterium]|nr:UDP-3-O-(3-hydroxymyristoyl)glucosamine N-acyltransferase [Candidatus Dormibacteraeota bacterium]
MTTTARDLAAFLGAELAGDPDRPVRGLAGPEQAGPDDLIYCESARYQEQAAASSAGTALLPPGMRLEGKTILQVSRPKLAFARAATLILGPQPIAQGVHPSAVIAPTARLGPHVAIGPFVVIEDGVEIGAGSEIGAFCFLGRGSRVGGGCRLFPRATLYPGVRLGDRVILHSGVVIGSDGFGYVRGPDRQWKFPQVGGAEIGDDVEIGANTTIDRGSLGTTRIEKDVKIDNLVQIAHNVTVGEHTVIAAQTGISGSSAIGAGAIIGGQVGMGDHAVVEEGAVVGSQAGILPGKRVRSGTVVWGTPCRPLDKFKQQHAWSARIPELAERLKALEKKLGVK